MSGEPMLAPLLPTKLYAPPARPRLVARARLWQRLEAGTAQKLTLVSAPAGFGKTTLVSTWRAQREGPVAWLALDEGDDDPVRFLLHLGAALAAVGVPLEGALEPLGQAPLQLALTSLIACLMRHERRVVLVLDDYHAITAVGVQQGVGFLLEHLPPQLSLILMSRVDPPLPLARLRAQGDLLELRAADLRFAEAEASEFFNDRLGLGLAPSEVAALTQRTEGWVAGLQLAALSLQGEANRPAFIRAFAGDNRYVLDYLLDEVFTRQPAALQDFLLETAILGRLHGPLCDAVRGGSGSQALLERLEQANLFLVPLDDRRRWYRYHHLFRDLLCHRLHVLRPGDVPELRRRAAAWFEGEGHFGEALEHLFAAEELAWAARLIERAGPTVLWERGEVATLQRWLTRFPQARLHASPKLCVLYAWSLHMQGDTERIAPWLASAEGDGALRAEVQALRSSAARMRGELPEAVALAEDALAHLPEGDAFLRGRVAAGRAEALFLAGDLAAADAAFGEARAICEAGGAVQPALFCLWRLADIAILRAETRRALALCEAMDALAATTGAQLGFADVVRGRLLGEWNDLDEAQACLERGIERGKRFAYPRVPLLGYAALARVRQARGDRAGALAVLDDAERFAAAHRVTWTWGVQPVAPYRARLALMAGEPEAAARWVASQGLRADDAPTHGHETDYFTLARVLIAQGQPADALRLLRRLLEQSRQGGRHLRVIEALALEALALQAAERLEDALAALGKALELAEPARLVRLFADEGEPMARLLRRLATRAPPAYAATLLGATAGAPAGSVETGLLNARELSVLRLMAGRLSNKEIAVELGLSVNTVKWYARGVFEKLGAHGRRSAVARAKEQGLL